MEKIISYWFFVVVVFSLFLVETSASSSLEKRYKNDTTTYNYTERVCIHDKLMIPNCEFSIHKRTQYEYKYKKKKA